VKVDDATLMEYVDGTLTANERLKMEKQIAASSDIARCVAHLQASRLPYREAFARQQLPPVPQSLAQRIGEMARLHAATIDAGAGSGHAHRYPASANETAPSSGAHPPRSLIRSRLRVAPGWLAVAFVAGAFCLGVVLRLTPAGDAPGTNPMSPSPWVQAAAGYQQLYSRATVLVTQPDAGVVTRTIDTIRREDQLALRVPDLRDAGLSFKQIQRLRFHGKPLVQLVYLPEKGEPVALCVMKQAGPDQAMARQAVSGMNVVTWRQGELAYALIATPGKVDLTALGRRIADRSVNQITGEVAAPGSSSSQG
jgi:anti-sigma factor RsiW